MPFKFNPLTGLLDMVIDPVELINHVDLLDMPDVGGINTDHDARYYTEAESDAILLAHIAIAAAHHARYTDAEADARIAIHTLIAAAHHAKTVSDEVYGLIRVGLFAGLPAPGILGRFYWATDNLILYYDTGAAWVETARGETVTRLAQLAERAHGSLTGVTAINHHTAAILEALLTTQNDVIVRGAAIPERLNIAVNSMVARAAANLVSLTIADNTFVGRGGTNLGGVAVATNEIVSRAAGNLGTLAIPVDRLVGRRIGQNLEAISPANVWGFLSEHPAAAVDMNGQFFSDMPVENGATVPASPRTGELFLHTPTGRNVLMMYDGSNWISIISLGTFTVYVDKTDGTDAIDKGTAVDADAFATVQYAVDRIPGLVGGNVIINVNNETYAEDVTIGGKALIGNYTITLQGTLVSQGTATGTAKVQGTGATQGTLTDAGEFGAFDNMLVYIATEDVYRLIDSDTADVLTIVGCFTDAANKTWTVYDWGTTIQSLTLNAGQTGIICNDLKTSSTSTSILIDVGCSASLYRGNFGYISSATCNIYFNQCKISSALYDQIYARAGSTLNFSGCKLIGQAGCANMIRVIQLAFIWVRSGTVIDGASVANIRGTRNENNSLAQFYEAAALGYVRIRNCAIGIYALSGGKGVFTSNIVYSGNTANETAVAASYGYID